ncbi:MAG: ATP-binding cassette domain-containing protein [Bacteroidales bacterium]|nr:ATP-binding cassette domain-containing protein [Bacteroidales bacterium]
METVLEVKGLIKYYGSLKAVNNLSFSVKKGSVFGFLGPNGSGKSTTLGIITKVTNPTAGEFSWFGEPACNAHLKRLGTLLERPNFYGYMDAVDNLKIVAEIRGKSADGIEDILRVVKLYDRRKSRFKAYSFGMQQRLAIASAMLGDPEVLILDEPTNGLDPEGIAEIRQMIIHIAGAGKTIILASHLLDEVQKVCNDVIILRNGSKIYEGVIGGISPEKMVLELKSPDMISLKEVAVSHPRILQIDMDGDLILAQLDSAVEPAEINSYMHKYGVSLSHLAVRHANLETQFLELLKTHKP